MNRPNRTLSRRALLGAGLASLAAPLAAQTLPPIAIERPAGRDVPRNTMSFKAQDWRPHFGSLRRGAILVDIDSRILHMWEENGAYHLYPSSVPMSEDMTRRGRTSVTRMVVGPGWTPTPNMRRRDPSLPAHIPPGPNNPLGTHAMHLGWKYYRIHGTHDPRKIGRRASSGCIGLYNEHIAEVFSMARVGTQVLLI
ncbi:L,D-transpeptidase [Jannaschia sp. LMIT008]|uniref:L,D-transpeptidase n=1 Tax=Jannaschia maritima TaxID=3032585 RepID=UPI00281251BE|nr:L,D-transpeptidase [Jannaschia sp. LMIT008]